MTMLTQAPRGTRDVLPADSYRWQYLESKVVRRHRCYRKELK